jgi:hypothetical protein
MLNYLSLEYKNFFFKCDIFWKLLSLISDNTTIGIFSNKYFQESRFLDNISLNLSSNNSKIANGVYRPSIAGNVFFSTTAKVDNVTYYSSWSDSSKNTITITSIFGLNCLIDNNKGLKKTSNRLSNVVMTME